jgi:hypothetical protein
MLCDVISAVTEFMAKVLQHPRAVRIPDVARVEYKPGPTCEI